MVSLPVIDAAQLRALGQAAAQAQPCDRCAPVRASAGWEAVPGAFDTRTLKAVATLRRPEVDDPTLDEYHPQGTNSWSADAPIAPAFHPYNRCEVWACVACGRPFLRYTEYGGYYQEARIRPVIADRVVDATP